MKNNLNKDKLKIYIDFDNTICMSDLSLVNTWNELNPNNKIEYTKEHDWNFYPMVKDREQLKELFKMFDRKEFYSDRNFRWVDSNVKQVLDKLIEYNCDITIISKHKESRKPLTKQFIEKQFGDKIKIIFTDDFNKSKYIDKCDIFIDDRVDACEDVLQSSKSKEVLCFGNYDWNKNGWNGQKFTTWEGLWFYIVGMYGDRLYKEI